MFFLMLFFFLSCAASNDVHTVIVHMPGNGNGGLQFLNLDFHKLNCQGRSSEELNPQKLFSQCYFSEDILTDTNKIYIYTNNISKNQMDLGGLCCVKFYKEMILWASLQYPHADIILAGASQGSVGPFGALAQLAQEKNPVLLKIKKVLIESTLGSTHEAMNKMVQKIPILKIFPYISDKIMPLLAEYLPRFIPGFAQYDAFAPQMYHYANQIAVNKEGLDHINYFIIHDLRDPIIPYECALNVYSFLPKNQTHFTQTDFGDHLPAVRLQSLSNNFITGKDMKDSGADYKRVTAKNNAQTVKPPIDNWFISKTPFQRFAIRRIRDLISITTLFILFRSMKYVYKKFIWHLKSRSC